MVRSRRAVDEKVAQLVKGTPNLACQSSPRSISRRAAAVWRVRAEKLRNGDGAAAGVIVGDADNRRGRWVRDADGPRAVGRRADRRFPQLHERSRCGEDEDLASFVGDVEMRPARGKSVCIQQAGMRDPRAKVSTRDRKST